MKVSVCIATYNGERYINEQLTSILSQISFTDEIIISDNYSQDLTKEVIASLADPRVTIYLSSIRGVVANFENALKNASGDIIILADQDDVWLDGKVDRVRRELKVCDLVITDCRVVDEKLNLLHESLFKLIPVKSGILNNLIKNSYTGCCMAFNKNILDAALPFPNDLPMHDWWIGLVAEITGSVKFIDEPFLLYRRHGNNASTLSNSSKLSLWRKINFRINMIKNLVNRFIIK